MLTQEWDMGKALDTRFMEGIERGRSEGADRRSVETARRMLADGLTPDKVSKYTGLSLEKINALKQ